MDTTNEEPVAKKFRPSLRAIVDEIVDLLHDVEAAEGEVTIDVGARLDELGLDIEHKVEAYAQAERRLKEDAIANGELEKHYAQRKDARTNQADALKARMKAELERLGVKKIHAQTASASIQNNAPGVELLCAETAVPPEYVELIPRVKRAEILADLKAGKPLKFARITQGTHLRFR
jgi:hypothetical protein